jgi:hypothetical protein
MARAIYQVTCRCDDREGAFAFGANCHVVQSGDILSMDVDSHVCADYRAAMAGLIA